MHICVAVYFLNKIIITIRFQLTSLQYKIQAAITPSREGDWDKEGCGWEEMGWFVFQHDAVSGGASRCLIASSLLHPVDYKQPAGSEHSLFILGSGFIFLGGGERDGKPFTLPKAVVMHNQKHCESVFAGGKRAYMQPEWKMPDNIISVVTREKMILD